MIELADYGHDLSVRGPDRETHSLDTERLHNVRAERVVALVMRTLSVEVKIKIRQQGRETVRIVNDLNGPAP